MSRQLKKLLVAMLFLFTGLSAHADETMDSLEVLKSKIQNTANTVLDSRLTNEQRLALVKKQKPELELELKSILQKEVRDPKTDSIHDAAYDVIDDMMIGITALSLLELKSDKATMTDESCERAFGVVNYFSQGARSIKAAGIPNFKNAIKMMCWKPSPI